MGRKPNADDLGLEAAGVAVDKRGYIIVDDQLRTNVPGVWAMGDCNGKGAFTHTSYNDAEIVAAMKPYYAIRVVGGLLYLAGALIMAFNVWMTIAGRLRDEAPMSSPKFNPAADRPLVPAAVAAE